MPLPRSSPMAAVIECRAHRHRTSSAVVSCWATTAFKWWQRSITGAGNHGVITQHAGRMQVRLYGTSAEARAVAEVIEEIEDSSAREVYVLC